MALRDYDAWHAAYDDPGSGLSWRLRTVQRHVADSLDARVGPVRLVSACAGDGRDVIGVLAGRDDAARVHATLLEVHPGIAARAQRSAAEARLAGQVDVRTVDAGTTDAYAGLVPADLVLLVGVFGNVPDADLRTTVSWSPALCAPGATLIWTRGRDADMGGDRNGEVRASFAAAGFTELSYETPDPEEAPTSRPAVGVVRYDGDPMPLVPGQHLFTFRR